MTEREYKRRYYRYVVGFVGALLLVYLAYFAATQQWLEGTGLAVLLLLVASVQLFLQMFVFLHVKEEDKPRFTMWSIVYTFVMVAIIVVASLWIMANMNYNMHMSPEQMEEFMIGQNKKGF